MYNYLVKRNFSTLFKVICHCWKICMKRQQTANSFNFAETFFVTQENFNMEFHMESHLSILFQLLNIYLIWNLSLNKIIFLIINCCVYIKTYFSH